MLRKLDVGVQGGGGPSREKLAPIHVGLNAIFREKMTGDYYDGIDGMGFLFRVSGEIVDFGGSGPERLFHRKKQKSIEIDIVFPEELWRSLSPPELWEHTAIWLREAMAMMIARGEKAKVIRDRAALERDFDASMAAFLTQKPPE